MKIVTFLVTPKAGAKHELLFKKPASEVGLLNIWVSSTVKCDQNHNMSICSTDYRWVC